jgi:outer membrane protein TolC
MLRTALFAAVFATLGAGARAEVHQMTLRQAVDRAIQQNPDVSRASMSKTRSTPSAWRAIRSRPT